ncbi:hypothetical protein Tco_1570575 [Tanacetum coccineum]
MHKPPEESVKEFEKQLKTIVISALEGVIQPHQETSVEILQSRENLMKSIQTFLKKFNRISFRETPKVLSLAWENFFEIQHAFREKQHQPEDIQELLRKLLKDLQIISEKLAEYINSPSWNCPAFYDDDDDVEDLVPIPSESKGISDDTCDVHFCDNSPPLDVLNDHFKIFSDFNVDCTSSDDDSFEEIDYIEASPPDSELVSLEEVKDDILREKLLNINLLIAKIESLNDNPTPDCVLKSPSPFPIPVEDSDSFFEKSDTSLSYSDNSLPEFETFSDHTEETSSGSTTTHADNSLPEYDSFLFEIEPDQGELTSVVMEDILGEPRVHVPNVLPTHPTLMLDSDFIPSDDSLGSDLEVSFPSGTRNKIFDPGIFFEVQSKRFLSRDTFSISFIRNPLCPVIETLLPFSSENEDKVFNPGKYSGRTHGGIRCSSSQTSYPLTEKELHQLRMDEEALKEMLEEEAMNKKTQEAKIRQEQAENDAFFLEFGVVRYDSEYESSD